MALKSRYDPKRGRLGDDIINAAFALDEEFPFFGSMEEGDTVIEEESDAEDEDAVKYDRRHASKGGEVVEGKEFKGGQFTPGGGASQDAPEMLGKLQETGGFTYTGGQKKFQNIGEKGYSVSPYPERSVILDRAPTVAEVREFMLANKDLLQKEGHAVGAWHDTESGKTYLDVAIVTEDRDEAERLGKEHNQKSIFDFATGSTIDTGGTGEAPSDSPGHGSDGRGDSGGSQEPDIEGVEGDGSEENPYQVGTDTELAAVLLADGNHVELDQPEELSSLLDEIREYAANRKSLGQNVPRLDMCKVSLPGTNLFCQDNKDIPRIQMPQLSKVEDEFVDYLERKGFGVKETNVKASKLRASQNEIDGEKLAGLVAKGKKALQRKRIFVTKDNYILDGHHHWAALTVLGADKGKDLDIKVYQIDMKIGRALHEANKFVDANDVPHSYRRWDRPWKYAAKSFAPKGYTKDHPLMIGGKPYIGGQWIPEKVLKSLPKDEVAGLKEKGVYFYEPEEGEEDDEKSDYEKSKLEEQLEEEASILGKPEEEILEDDKKAKLLEQLELNVSTSALMKWMGKNGWTAAEAAKVLDELGLPFKKGTLSAQIHIGKTGKEGYGKAADLSEKQSHILFQLKEGEFTATLEEVEPEETAPEVHEGEDILPKSLSELTADKKLGGSGDAALYTDKDGNKFVVKSERKGSEGQIEQEVAVDNIYRAMGFNTPASKVIDGKKVSAFVDGLPLGLIGGNIGEEMQKGFVLDALLGNWDVVGQNKDNVLVTDSKVYRIDNGGSLNYRAQGSSKGSLWNYKVSELESMRDPSINPTAASVYKGITASQIKKQIATILKNKEKILDLAPAKQKQMLSDRMQYLDQWSKEHVQAKKDKKTGTHTYEFKIGEKDYALTISTAIQKFVKLKYGGAPAINPGLPDWSREIYKTMKNKEASSIKAYTGNDYKQINQYLWEKSNPNLPTKKTTDESVKKKICAIQKAFRKLSKMPDGEPVTVYRRAYDPGGKLFAAMQAAAAKGEKAPDNVVKLKGFTSASTEKSYANSSGLTLTIIAKKGIDVSPIGKYGKNEGEILLPHNQRYRILKTWMEGGSPRAMLEQL